MKPSFPLIDKLGGEAAAFDVLDRRMDWRPTRNNFCKWVRERRLSHKVAFFLAVECAKRGIAIDQNDIALADAKPKRRVRPAARPAAGDAA